MDVFGWMATLAGSEVVIDEILCMITPASQPSLGHRKSFRFGIVVKI